MLVDTGCNSLMIDVKFARAHGLKVYPADQEILVQWGEAKSSMRTARMCTARLQLWMQAPGNKKHVFTYDLPLIVAPLRVDAILGLPLLHALPGVHLTFEGYPALTFLADLADEAAGEGAEAGKMRVKLEARPTSRRWQAEVTCNAAHLRAPYLDESYAGRHGSKSPDRRSCDEARSAASAQSPENAKNAGTPFWRPISDDHAQIPMGRRAFWRMVRKKKAVDVYTVYVRPMRQYMTVHAAAIDAKTAVDDPLAEVPGDHPLRSTLEGFRNSLFVESTDLPPDRGEDNFSIELLPDARPAFLPLRKMGDAELAELHKQVSTLLERGWIRHSNSPWGAAVLFAPKKDGGLRCCIDYRALNRQTKKDRTPLPNLTELRDRLRHAKVFTNIDIKDAYHRIRINPDDVEKTAFRTRFGHFEYLVLTFGFTNAPATFQRLMNKVLGHLYDKTVVSYLDDVLIYSETMDDHKKHVQEVLQLLADHQLFVKPSKCRWAVDELEFCGHMIGVNGIGIAKSKVEAVLAWEPPTSAYEIQSFLGLTNYLSTFVDHYAEIALPLTRLQSGRESWQWKDQEQAAFEKLRQAIAQAPTLAIYDPDGELYVFTDASGFAIGGWLAQPAAAGYPSPLPTTITALKNLPALRPVSYFSKKMLPAETRYPVYEQELLALVRCLSAHRHWLLGRPFRAFTDHRSLIYLQNQVHLSRRQASWVEILQQFDCSIEYLPGRFNHIADILSRTPTFAPRCATCRAKVHLALVLAGAADILPLSVPDPGSQAWLDAQRDDSHAQFVVTKLANSSERQSVQIRRYALDSAGCLRYHEQFYVPAVYRPALLPLEHDSVLAGGHSGEGRTLAKLLRRWFWPGIAADVSRYVRSCGACQRFKSPARAVGFLRSLPVPAHRWAQVGLDLAFLPRAPIRTPSSRGEDEDAGGEDAVLVVVDYLTTRAYLIPTRKTATAKEIARLCFTQIWRNTGVPETIISDRDSRWLSNFWHEFMKLCGIDQALSTARHQQTDGKCEKVIQTLKRMLKPYLNYAGDNWVDLLPVLEFNYNRTPGAMGYAPFEADLGRIPRLPAIYDAHHAQGAATPLDDVDRQRLKLYADGMRDLEILVQHQLREDQEKQARAYDKRRRTQTFRIGDKVLLKQDELNLTTMTSKSEKLSQAWIGPFAVEALGPHPDTYRLTLPTTMGIYPVFHTGILKPWIEPASCSLRKVDALPAPVIEDGEVEYFVDEILAERARYGKREFLVRWRGYADEENTWEPVRALRGTEALVRWQQQQQQQRHPAHGGPRSKRARR
jgi:hypothetical protein